MSMTGSELYDYILRTFKRTDKSTELYETISQIIMDMKIQFNSEAFKTIGYTAGIDTLGEYSFSLPDNFGHLIGDVKLLDGTDSYPLKKVTKPSYDKLEANPEYANSWRGTPTHYCVYAKQIFIYPVPDSLDYQYELNYTEEDATAVVAGTAIVDFTDRYADAIKYGVLSRMYLDLGLDDEGLKYKNLYDTALSKIIQNDEDNIKAQGFVRYRDF